MFTPKTQFKIYAYTIEINGSRRLSHYAEQGERSKGNKYKKVKYFQ